MCFITLTSLKRKGCLFCRISINLYLSVVPSWFSLVFFFLFHLGQKCLKSDAVLSSLKPIKRYKRSICPILGDVHLVSPLYIYSVNGEEISRLCKCPVFIKLTRTHFNIHWWFLPESIITVTVATWWFFFCCASSALHVGCSTCGVRAQWPCRCGILSPTRDQTSVINTGRQTQPLDHQGSSQMVIFLNSIIPFTFISWHSIVF